jgi:hypothetical protein
MFLRPKISGKSQFQRSSIFAFATVPLLLRPFRSPFPTVRRSPSFDHLIAGIHFAIEDVN